MLRLTIFKLKGKSESTIKVLGKNEAMKLMLSNAKYILRSV